MIGLNVQKFLKVFLFGYFNVGIICFYYYNWFFNVDVVDVNLDFQICLVRILQIELWLQILIKFFERNKIKKIFFFILVCYLKFF